MREQKNTLRKNIYVLWIFNGIGKFVSEEKIPSNIDKVRVLGIEKRVHNLYGGRIYYMNVREEEVLAEPYALHFSHYFENKQSETSVYGYKIYYKEFHSATVGVIPTFKIVCYEYSGYKLARFMDKNVSISCTDQLLICIREICLKRINKVSSNEKYEFSLSLDNIIDFVKEDFGYFLPYLILKKSKRIKKVKFEKTIDEIYNSYEILTFKITDYL